MFVYKVIVKDKPFSGDIEQDLFKNFMDAFWYAKGISEAGGVATIKPINIDPFAGKRGKIK